MGPQRYLIVAKIPAGNTTEQFRAMLQNLLAVRVHLALHHQTRQQLGLKLNSSKVPVDVVIIDRADHASTDNSSLNAP